MTQAIELEIGGMTCSSCAARIEKRLNRMPGVEASVNYATEKATVTLAEGTTIDEAVAVVEATGYTARPRTAKQAPVAETDPAGAGDGTAALRHRLVLSAALTTPVLALSMSSRCSSTTGSGSP